MATTRPSFGAKRVSECSPSRRSKDLVDELGIRMETLFEANDERSFSVAQGIERTRASSDPIGEPMRTRHRSATNAISAACARSARSVHHHTFHDGGHDGVHGRGCILSVAFHAYRPAKGRGTQRHFRSER
jgi:hypothetical protein